MVLLKFSERKGLKDIKTDVLLNNVSKNTRIRLWNVFYKTIWSFFSRRGIDPTTLNYIALLWDEFFHYAIDTIPNIKEIYNFLRECFLKKFQWFELFDFIEFILEKDFPFSENFVEGGNNILEQESSGYRIVGNRFFEDISQEEIKEIENVLNYKEVSDPVKVHIKNALEKLTDKKAPDFRNSIKESISAVESICRLITGSQKTTLGQALKKIDTKIKIHPALKNAFEKLYGYTSDESGIRHSLIDESNVDYGDARFILISCSAFVNYLIRKSSEARINLNQ